MNAYENLSDEELVALTKAGDLDSETELLYRYKTTVKQAARGFFLTGGETEDLLQEGMIALYSAIRSYNPDKNASFKTFAVMCVKRQLIDLIRRQKPAPPVETEPTVCVDNDDEQADLWEKIRSVLNADENEILDGYLAGLTYEEIALSIGVTAKKVDNELQKIKRVIKKTVENY